MPLGEVRLQRQRAFGCLASVPKPHCVRRPADCRLDHQRVCQRGPRRRVVRVEATACLKYSMPAATPVLRAASHQEPPLQVEPIRLRIVAAPHRGGPHLRLHRGAGRGLRAYRPRASTAAPSPPSARCRPAPRRCRRARGRTCRDHRCESVATSTSCDRDAHALAGLAHAALEDRRHVELRRATVGMSTLLPLKLKADVRDATRRPRIFEQHVEQFLRDAVGKVLVGRVVVMLTNGSTAIDGTVSSMVQAARSAAHCCAGCSGDAAGDEAAALSGQRGSEAVAAPRNRGDATCPSILRSAEICTCRLFSSTTRSGQTSSSNSSLVTSRSPAARARATDRRRADPARPAHRRASNRRSAGCNSKTPNR